MKPILVIAGEASGDLHGFEILKAVKLLKPDIKVVGVGGSLMTPFLDRKLADVCDLSVMGLVEVVEHLPKLARLFKKIVTAAAEEDISGALLIDYPGFNIRLAKALKKNIPNARLHQFVCPQVWAWKAGRIPTLGNLFDVIYCLFDFEPKLFDGYPVEAICMGNPIVGKVVAEVSRNDFFALSNLDPNRPFVALLPGSRMAEIERLMPPLVELVRSWQYKQELCAVQWVIPVASTLQSGVFDSYIRDVNISVVHGLNYASLAYADAALVCSGTATLEAAMLGTPFAAIYKLNGLTYLIAKRLVKTPYFSLANIVAGYNMVPELLQADVTVQRLSEELAHLLDSKASFCMRVALEKIHNRLGEPGAADRVAHHLLNSVTR
jgi:lipid-A-disaccharide synthase